MAYEPGDQVADYQVLSILGAGGMGKVYKVRNTISERVEAMKVLLPNLAEQADLADRFIREIKLQATLTHPNIAALHTAFRHENQLLMLMEFVDGITIDDLVKSGPLHLEEAVDYMAQVLDALSYAHAKGIIHRDLKPANMMLTPEGAVKLLDFGIAKMTADHSLTKTGFLVGSLPYISPEQIEGAADIDARTDIYSLGITLYQAVTGKVPFHADSEYSLMRKHLQEAPVPPVQVMSDVPPALNDIILRAIEKDRARRYQSASEMASALRSLGIAPNPAAASAPTIALAAPPPPPPPPPPPAPPVHAQQPPPFAPPPIPQPKGAPSNRGLWLALGAILGIAVLALAAFQLPKFFKTKAAGDLPTPVVEQPQQQPQPQPEAQPPAPPQPEPQPPAQAATQPPAPAATPQRPSSSSSTRPAATQHSSAPTPQYQQQQHEQPAPYQQQQQTPPPQPQTQAYSSPSQPAPDQAVLSDLRHQMMLLGSRVNAANSSLNRLKQEQARQGLGLRGDIAAAAQRVEYLMDEVDAALKRGDADAAKKHLAAAERETSRLETFLGR